MNIQDHFEIDDGVLKAYTGTDPEAFIPEGVHTIGEGAFKGMAWLKKVVLPSTLKKIGPSAFKGCRQLQDLTFPEGLEEVSGYAFHRCHGLTEAVFPTSVGKVGDCVFLYCDHLKKVVLEGPTHFGKAEFSHCLALRELVLNADADDSNFSDEVFMGCINLERITLSGRTYEVGNLINVMDSHTDFPGLIKSVARSVYSSMQIEDGVLKNFNINLKDVFLPEGIVCLGKGCFFDKKGIVRITLPESLKEIRENAFLNCQSLEEVIFPNGNAVLSGRAFRGCCNLKKVVINGETYPLENETENLLAGRIRDQVLGDFYISGRILVRYMGNEEQVTIPKEVEIIGERCFFGREQLKTVLCPDGLREIREQAFAGCLTLQNIVLPATLKRVEREAFAECRKLIKCNLPDGMECIGEYAFRRCLALKPFEPWPASADIHPYAFYLAKEFEQPAKYERRDEAASVSVDRGKGASCIPDYAFTGREGIGKLELTDVEMIGKYAYDACPGLTEIVIDSPGCVIGRNAFSRCPGLKKVCLNVARIEKAAFAYCRQLEEVRVSGVSELPAECFAGCCSLHVFEAREVMQIGARCFDECKGLDSFELTDIKCIGERAFERCDSLKNVKLSGTECGFHAFADCAELETVEITDDTVLRSGVFTGCAGVKRVVFNSESFGFSKFADSLNRVDNHLPERVREVIASVYSCFVIKEGSVLTAYLQDASAVTIPDDVEEIGQDVFRDHIRLEKVNIPVSVGIVGSHAFSQTAWLDSRRKASEMVIVNGILLDGAGCRGTVVIPPEVRRLAGWCFAGNTAITGLVIPSDAVAIENLAFRNCLNLREITDRDGSRYVLSSVSDLTCREYPELVQRIFTECINCFKLDGDGRLVESTGNITDLVFPDGIRSIEEGVYKDCHLLESIVLSDDTASIGRSAFENSRWLKKVSGAGSVSSVGAQAFSGCQSLEEIDLSDRLRELGSRCFEHCCSLKDIHISEQLEEIPERTFFRCRSLKELVIPKSVKTVGPEAFAFCTGLEKVYVHEDTGVADRAFAYCDSAEIIRYSQKADKR